MKINYSYPTKSEDRFNQTVSVLILLIMFLLVFHAITLSWYGNSDTQDKVITIGNIAITVTSDLDFNNIVLEPDKEYAKQTTIIGSTEQNNTITNDAYLRVKLATEQKIGGANIIYPIYNTNNWIYDFSDGWYYYVGIINSTNGTTFNTALKVVNTINNSHKGTNVNITLTVEAIQKEFEAYKDAWPTAPLGWLEAIQEFE